jgi:hypothetical protein
MKLSPQESFKFESKMQMLSRETGINRSHRQRAVGEMALRSHISAGQLYHTDREQRGKWHWGATFQQDNCIIQTESSGGNDIEEPHFSRATVSYRQRAAGEMTLRSHISTEQLYHTDREQQGKWHWGATFQQDRTWFLTVKHFSQTTTKFWMS